LIQIQIATLIQFDLKVIGRFENGQMFSQISFVSFVVKYGYSRFESRFDLNWNRKINMYWIQTQMTDLQVQASITVLVCLLSYVHEACMSRWVL